jgi:23S rRNA-/tRNA-specific pseudouridylate synthase
MDKIRFVHNLDSATSGILVVGKTREATARCVSLFEKRRVQKDYLAVVAGHVEWDEMTVEAAIEKDPDSQFCMRVAGRHGMGKAATTHM